MLMAEGFAWVADDGQQPAPTRTEQPVNEEPDEGAKRPEGGDAEDRQRHEAYVDSGFYHLA